MHFKWSTFSSIFPVLSPYSEIAWILRTYCKCWLLFFFHFLSAALSITSKFMTDTRTKLQRLVPTAANTRTRWVKCPETRLKLQVTTCSEKKLAVHCHRKHKEQTQKYNSPCLFFFPLEFQRKRNRNIVVYNSFLVLKTWSFCVLFQVLFSTSEALHIEFVTKSGRVEPTKKPYVPYWEIDDENKVQRKGFKAQFEIGDKFVNLGQYLSWFCCSWKNCFALCLTKNACKCSNKPTGKWI